MPLSIGSVGNVLSGKRAKILTAAAFLAAISLLGLLSADEEGPKQPIEFSHKIHAGDNKIDCLYCHSYADRSPVAGIPSVARCMGCHKIIAKESAEVKKIAEYFERQQPVPWIKVYDLPDFVRFNHKRHLLAGLNCQTCHGAVESMDRVYQVSSLEMGWCLKCHYERQAPVDCLTCHY